MNTTSNDTPLNSNSNMATDSQMTSQAITPTRPMYWSVRRELWENRLIYLAPLTAAIVFLVGFLIKTIVLRHRMHGLLTLNAQQHDALHGLMALSAQQQHDAFSLPYETASVLIMGTAFLVGIFYSLDALYGERRDRSILFWKSLPVSDLTTVLSKVVIPIVILPLLSFAITIVTQFAMLLLSSVVLLGSGVGISTLWTQSSFIHESLMFFYHIVTVHGLWYAPFYGWLLLISAWAPRAPFIWAFLPPFVICGAEKLAFNTSYCLDMLQHRLTGPTVSTRPPGSTLMDAMAAITPIQFFTLPGLWIGLAICAAFLVVAVQVRRHRGPI